jgi:hypothetical protein
MMIVLCWIFQRLIIVSAHTAFDNKLNHVLRVETAVAYWPAMRCVHYTCITIVICSSLERECALLYDPNAICKHLHSLEAVQKSQVSSLFFLPLSS